MTSVEGPRPKKRALIVLLLILLVVGLIYQLRSNQTSIRLGFIGGLSGRAADLGQDGRDGALLAVEEANRNGGIAGQTIELLIRDDAHNPETAQEVAQDLLSKDVVAVIGHMTSAMSVATVPLFNQAKTLLLSPTTSTNDLSGKKDWFFRLYPDGHHGAVMLAHWARFKRGLKKAAIILDTSNSAFSQSWSNSFTETFTQNNGQLMLSLSFFSGPEINFNNYAQTIAKSDIDSVLILANTVDTALLLQKLRPLRSDIVFMASEWSMTEQLLKVGGKAVEGLTFFHTFNPEHQGKGYLRFKEAFQQRFGRIPGFAAMKSYDATQIILQALSLAPAGQLRETLLQLQPFNVLQSTFEFDAFGDPLPHGFIMKIRQGRFTLAEN